MGDIAIGRVVIRRRGAHGHAGAAQHREERLTAWGAETLSSCCGGDLVLVDEAAEQVASPHAKILRLGVGSHG